jgi:hypothetical protein
LSKSPAEQHPPENLLVVQTDDDEKLELFVDPVGVATGGSKTSIDNPRWTIRARRIEYRGWEASIYETERKVNELARAWWSEKRRTLPG